MSSGTITDVDYPGGYFWHQAPALMNYIAAINGFSPTDISREFTYCELGCGRGVTATVLAALHPRGRFVACDLNLALVRAARALAAAGEITNVEFLGKSVAEMGSATLPKFDFVTLHGLWSWVSDQARAEIKAFLGTSLKPGGLVMLSYNAMPGWCNVQPVQHMMRTYTEGEPGDSAEKGRQAVAHLRMLADNQAPFFLANPAALSKLEEIEAADVRYVAHEYMVPWCQPFYFAEVSRSLGEIGLVFVGSMNVAHNYPELSIAPQFKHLLETAPTRQLLEAHRDFINNTGFRLDLFAAQPSPSVTRPVQRPRFDETEFRLLGRSETLPLNGDREIKFNFAAAATEVRAVHALLTANGTAKAADIQRALGGKSVVSARLLQDLVLARHLWPSVSNSGASDCGKLQVALAEIAKKDGQKHVLKLTPEVGGADYITGFF